MKPMIRVSMVFALSFVTAVFASASTHQSRPCPKVTITYQNGPLGTDGARTFHAQLVDAIPGKSVFFNWSGTYGQHLNDNGLPSITMKAEPQGAAAVYVDVLGEGIPEGCVVQDFRLVKVEGSETASDYYDHFADFPEGQELLHLKNFAKQLAQDPDATGYVAVKGSHNANPRDTTAHIERIRWFLTDQCGIKPERIILVAAKPDEDFPWIRVWVLQPGDKLPDPNSDEW